MEEGLRIRSGNNFRDLFSVVFPALHNQMWFGPIETFDDPPEDFRDQFIVNVHEVWEKGASQSESPLGWWSRKDIFPKYADMINEDWNGIFATGNQSWNGVQLLKQFRAIVDRGTFIKKHCTVCFLSTEGAFWEFFAKERSLLKSVENHIKNLPNSEVEKCSLQASPAL